MSEIEYQGPKNRDKFRPMRFSICTPDRPVKREYGDLFSGEGWEKEAEGGRIPEMFILVNSG